MNGRFIRRLAAAVVVAGCLAVVPAAGAAVGGPVILGGDDLTDHGSYDTSTNQPVEGWLYLQRAIENVSPKVGRVNDGTIAALGSADSTGTCCDAGAAMHYAAEKAGLPVTYYNGATAIDDFFAALAAGTANPRIIWIAGDDSSNDIGDTGCSGPGSEGQSLIDHASQLDAFVSSGGGLISHGTCYDWLTALLPGITTVHSGGSDDLYFLPEGSSAFPGVTVGDINAGPWHNHFEGDFGGLQVLVRSGEVDDASGNDAAVILGGAGVSLTRQPADVSISKTATPTPATNGGTLSYIVTASNAGPGGATDVVATDTLPAGTEFVSATASQGTCTGTATVSCSFGSIASGASANATITVRTVQTGTITNVARVTAAEPDPNLANNEARVDTIVGAARVAAVRCAKRLKFTWEVHHGPDTKVVKVQVFVNGKKVKTVRGKNIKRVSIRRLAGQLGTVKIVSFHSNGARIVSTRKYKGCKKTKPKNRGFHGRSGR
jgi:uncharacterized repeat protein (TIGR01451 family)